MNTESNKPDNPDNSRGHGRLWKVFISYILPLCIVLLAVFTAKRFIETRPRAERGVPEKQAKLVMVETVARTNTVVTVSAMGTVLAARKTTLTPQVSGKILSMSSNVIPGGVVADGEELIQIESSDYRAIVEQRRSELARAQMNLRLEQGSQVLAEQEYEMLEDEIANADKELVLRKPQLRNYEAAVDAAKAALEKAILDVERCSIEAPYNGLIIAKNVDPGAAVSQSSSLLTVVGVDEYWVEVSVPVDKLKWIDIPDSGDEAGAPAKIYNSFAWGDGVYREAKVIRLLGQLEESGRMARLLLSIADPLALNAAESESPRLLIDSYVRAEIQGDRIESVVRLERDYLHNGDQVWVMTDDDTLDIREVHILFRGRDAVFIDKGLREGERIVVSDLPAAVDGMLLRVETGDSQFTSLTNAETDSLKNSGASSAAGIDEDDEQ